MTTTIEGDYSKYPVSIREVFPHLAGEACELRQSWVVYSHLFMEKKEFTDAMAERLGGVLVMFQSLRSDIRNKGTYQIRGHKIRFAWDDPNLPVYAEIQGDVMFWGNNRYRKQ